MKTKHKLISLAETVPSFIYCLELEHLAKEYTKHFNRHGFNRKEAGLMDKMVQRHGAFYIGKVLE